MKKTQNISFFIKKRKKRIIRISHTLWMSIYESGIQHVMHYYFINFFEGLFPHVSEAHWVYFFTQICYYDSTNKTKDFNDHTKLQLELTLLLILLLLKGLCFSRQLVCHFDNFQFNPFFKRHWVWFSLKNSLLFKWSHCLNIILF